MEISIFSSHVTPVTAARTQVSNMFLSSFSNPVYFYSQEFLFVCITFFISREFLQRIWPSLKTGKLWRPHIVDCVGKTENPGAEESVCLLSRFN